MLIQSLISNDSSFSNISIETTASSNSNSDTSSSSTSTEANGDGQDKLTSVAVIGDDGSDQIIKVTVDADEDHGVVVTEPNDQSVRKKSTNTLSVSFSLADEGVGSTKINRMVSTSSVTLRENLASLPKTTPNGSKPDKLYFNVHELYTTERDYVDTLCLLTQDFRKAVEDVVEPEFLQKFVKPFETIRPLNERLLELLRKRVLEEWDAKPTVSGIFCFFFDLLRSFSFDFIDIFIENAPFFKSYSIYIMEYDRLNHMLNENIDKEWFSKYRQALSDFENTDRCRKLRVIDHIVKPVQRLGQYPLMLKSILKCIDVTNPDRAQMEKAFDMISDIVTYLNDIPSVEKSIVDMHYLRSKIIWNANTYCMPPQKLIKHGYLAKMSRKKIEERYFVLVSITILEIILFIILFFS